MEQVEAADHYQLGRWYRFLQSPGWSATNQDNFEQTLEEQTKIMDRICERFAFLGGMTPRLSKMIGWDP